MDAMKSLPSWECLSVRNSKAVLRRSMLGLRRKMSKEEVQSKSGEIARNLTGTIEYGESRLIAFYASFDNEVDTWKLIEESLREGKRVAIPFLRSPSEGLLLSEVRDLTRELTEGSFGILEPKAEFIRPIPLEQVELLIVPGVAFDRRGYRLGFGKGYYDRLLKAMLPQAVSVGLAYSFQVLDRVPTEKGDEPVARLITEAGAMDCVSERFFSRAQGPLGRSTVDHD